MTWAWSASAIQPTSKRVIFPYIVDLKQLFKSGSVIYAETARFIATHRKEEREGLNAKLESILTTNGLVVADRKLKHHLECHKL